MHNKNQNLVNLHRKPHCVYKSNGDLVTGEPVSILLYLASLPNAK